MKELNVEQTEMVTGGSLRAWLRGSLGSLHQAQAEKNYREYRERRDRSGDRAARARSRSRSDMNGPNDRHGPRGGR